MNGHTVEARANFIEGLRLAQESHPVDTEAEERINRQLLWLNENESTINDLYQRKQREAEPGAEEEKSVKDVWALYARRIALDRATDFLEGSGRQCEVLRNRILPSSGDVPEPSGRENPLPKPTNYPTLVKGVLMVEAST